LPHRGKIRNPKLETRNKPNGTAGVGPTAGSCIASRMGFSPCGLCAVASSDAMVSPTRTKEPALHGLDVPTCAVYADEVADGLDIHLDFTTSRRIIGDCPSVFPQYSPLM